MSKRAASIQESQSTLLNSGLNDGIAPKDKRQKIVPNSPQLRQLLMKKIIVDPETLNSTTISASQEEKANGSETKLSSLPTAFEVSGIPEEKDKNNTMEPRKMLRSDTTLETIISLCSDESDREEESSDHSHLSLDPDSLEVTSGDLSVMGPNSKEKGLQKGKEKEEYSIINLTSESETADGTQCGSGSEEEESDDTSTLDRFVRFYSSRYAMQTSQVEETKSKTPVEQVEQTKEMEVHAISDCSLSESSIGVDRMESDDESESFIANHRIRKESFSRSLFSPTDSPHRIMNESPHRIMNESPRRIMNESPHRIMNESPHRIMNESPNPIHQSPTHSSFSSPMGSPSKEKKADPLSRIPSISLSQQSNPMSPPLSQTSNSSRHRTLLVSLEEELAYSELGKAILDSIRPLYVIGPFIRSPIHGVCLVMRQVNDVLKMIGFDIGICDG